MLGLLLILISKSWGCPPRGLGMHFLDSDTCAEGGGYLFLPGFFSLYDAIHGWMTRQMDGWMDGSREKASRKMTTTSFITSLNPVPNAKVCVYLRVHITKLQLHTTFPKPLYIPHSACIHWDPSC
jgi:hypothetical protein